MPSLGNGQQWLCARCGMGNFRDYNEAQQHEMNCDLYSRKRRRPPSPFEKNTSSYYKENTHHQQQQQQLQSANFHQEIQIGQNISNSNPNSQSSSKPSQIEGRFKPCIFIEAYPHPTEKISSLDLITCQNVEVFKASAGDVADHQGSSGMTVNKGQVGFRCIHCSKNPFAKAEYSSVFPGSLGSVAACLQLMTKVHFERCMGLDPNTRNQLQAARNSFRHQQDDEEWYSEAFVEYALEVCKRLNIINRVPPQTGLVFGPEGSSTTSNRSQTDVGVGVVGSSNYRYEGFQDTNVQSTPTESSKIHASDNQQQTIDSQYKSRDNTQYMVSVQKRDGEKQQASNVTNEVQPAIGPTPTRSLSPPTLYDSPGSPNFPYFQNQQGFWECRFCWGYPFNQRAQGCFWQSTQPPNRNFMEQHLNLCQNRNSINQNQNNFMNQSQNSMLSQSNQYDQMNQVWSTPKSRQSPYAQSSASQQMHTSPQSNMRPPMPRPPTAPSQYSTEGMNPQEAYAYQQMQMYNQMQMYQGGNDFNQGYGGFQQGMFSGQNMDFMAYNNQQKTPMEMRSESALKATLAYLEKEEQEIENRLSKSDNEEERTLVVADDKSLLTDYFYHVMKQLRFCRFSESDRKTRGGKRENIKVGFGGLKCVHCSETQNPRKFFWSNVDRLANSFAEIPGHVLKCRRCPAQTKQALQGLKQRHAEQMTQLPRGSQKVFFRRMWRRLHDDNELTVDAKSGDPSSSKKSGRRSSITPNDELNQSFSPTSQGNIIVGMSTNCAAKALAEYSAGKKPCTKILLAIDEDKSWLSDMDCFVRSNLELFCATKYDIEFAESDRKYPITEGQLGIRCIHCAVSRQGARGTSVSFPPFVNGIYESVREFHRVHLPSCPNLPEKCKEKLSSLKGSSSLSSVLRRYYVEAAEALGIYDTDEGMRGGGEVKPIGRKEDDDADLAISIRQIEESTQEYLNSSVLGQHTKRRKLGGDSRER